MLLDERLDGNTDRPDGNYAIRRVREELWVPKSNCHLLKPLWKGPKEIKHHFTSGTIILRYIFQLKASKGNCSKNVQVEAPFSLQQPNHWASQTVQEESPWWGGAQFGPPQLVGFLADFFWSINRWLKDDLVHQDLLLVSTHLKNMSQNGNLPQVGVEKKYLKPPPKRHHSLQHFV